MVGRRLSTTAHDLAVIQKPVGWSVVPLWFLVSIKTAYVNNYSAEVVCVMLLTKLHTWVQPCSWGGWHDAHAVQHTLSM